MFSVVSCISSGDVKTDKTVNSAGKLHTVLQKQMEVSDTHWENLLCQFSRKVTQSCRSRWKLATHTVRIFPCCAWNAPVHKVPQAAANYPWCIYRWRATTHFSPTLSSVSPNSSDELEDPARRVLAISATHIRGKRHTTLDLREFETVGAVRISGCQGLYFLMLCIGEY